jgi:4-hydroxy-2-oxoheptanedioate aldolase
MPCDEVVEMLAVAGMDFLVIDCEHGPADVMALRAHIALAEVHGVPVLVRPGEREPGLILRALDQGAQGIVAPHIETATEAQDLVAMVHYPPLGRRGFATYPRAGRFGTVSAGDHRQNAADTLVIAMLESPSAAAVSAEILSTSGVDGYLIGTADLSASSGEGDPPVAESVAAIHRGGAESWILAGRAGRRCRGRGTRAESRHAAGGLQRGPGDDAGLPRPRRGVRPVRRRRLTDGHRSTRRSQSVIAAATDGPCDSVAR